MLIVILKDITHVVMIIDIDDCIYAERVVDMGTTDMYPKNASVYRNAS